MEFGTLIDRHGNEMKGRWTSPVPEHTTEGKSHLGRLATSQHETSDSPRRFDDVGNWCYEIVTR
jgi:hypothetical protein